MIRRPFRLEAVLRIRRAQEESARHQLFVQNRHLHAQLQVLADDDARYKRIPVSQGPVPLGTFRREQAAADRAAAALVCAEAAVVSARADVSTAHRRWSEAATRVEALDRLRNRRIEDERALEARSEMVTIDDLITSRWVSPLTPTPTVSRHAAAPANHITPVTSDQP